MCVLFVGEQSLQKYYINACKKYIYILLINTLNLSTAYICIISISYLSRIVQDGFFLCHQLHFDIFKSVNPAESESHCNYITVDIKQDRL